MGNPALEFEFDHKMLTETGSVAGGGSGSSIGRRSSSRNSMLSNNGSQQGMELTETGDLKALAGNGSTVDESDLDYDIDDDLAPLQMNNNNGDEGPSALNKEHLNSDRHTAGHMFISFIGAGVLGLPFAFKKTGLAGALIILPAVGFLSTYAMMQLVDCKLFLERDGKHIRGYGDIGFHVSGRSGSMAVDTMLVITQVAFCCAYLLFIGENLGSVFQSIPNPLFIILAIPGLSLLVLYRHIKNLSPFALVADVANIIGMLVVISYDIEIFREHEQAMDHSLEHLRFGIIFSSLPYFFGVSLYCYEGVGVILPIQQSMENKENFKQVLSMTMIVVTVVYMLFGGLGYVAYGQDVREIITLNLGPGIPTNIVKFALSIGLFFTYPLMMFPVFTIMENTSPMVGTSMKVKSLARIVIVLFSAMIAIGIPNFGDFLALVGAGACACLALILPSYFHYKLFAHKLSFIEKTVDIVIIVVGSLFGVFGTVDAGSQLLSKLGT